MIELESSAPAALAAAGGTRRGPGSRRVRPAQGPSTDRRKPDLCLDPLPSRVKRLQKYFLEEDELTISGYRALFSLPESAAAQEIERLTSEMRLIRRGRKRGTLFLAGTELW